MALDDTARREYRPCERRCQAIGPGVTTPLPADDQPSPKQPGRVARRLRAAQEEYVLGRWNAGCRNARQIWQELVGQGHQGSARTVGRVVGYLRRHYGRGWKFRSVPPMAPGQEIRTTQEQRPYTAYRAALLFISRPEQRTEWQQAYVTRLCAADTSVATTYEQAQEFMQMIREREGSQLDGWLVGVAQTSGAELQSFAQGGQADHAAVFARLTLPWSHERVAYCTPSPRVRSL